MRVIFMGTPEFSVPALEALHASHDVVAVYTQPPRPAGRGKKDRPSPVQTRALQLGLEVRHPVTLKGAEQEIAALNADIAVVVAYGLILPQAVLDAPARGCLNIHASLLPRWRGAAPIHRAIMAGDAMTGICIMQMEAGLDTGPVRFRRETPIGEDETTGALHDRLSVMGAEAVVETLSRLDDLPPQPQDDAMATYASKIDKAEARVDWARPAAEVARHIRGLSPFPGAFTERDGTRIKFLNARVVDQTGKPGTVIDNFTIACGQGAVEITRAQRAGKGPQDAAEFLRGMPLATGDQL